MGGATIKDLTQLLCKYHIAGVKLQTLTEAQASAVLRRFADTPAPVHGNYEPLFDQIVDSIHEDRVYASQRQKHMLRMNGVMPSEFNSCFISSMALHNSIEAAIQSCQTFIEAHGVKPADGVSKELLMRWGVEIDPNTLTKDELYKLLQRHSGGARIKQYQELVIDYGIAPEKLRSLSESKATQIIQQFNTRAQASKRARENENEGPASSSASPPTAQHVLQPIGNGAIALGGCAPASTASGLMANDAAARAELPAPAAGQAIPSQTRADVPTAAPPAQRRRRGTAAAAAAAANVKPE